ncbi:Aspyridones efflux protein apdF [Colletotrichum siamense]|nr:Aspyridones efflux protein apdF [Colletotrichum siamense]
MMAVEEVELDKPAPDGGFKAWTMALLGHLVTFNTWGYFLCYGVFQTYYVSSLSRSLSDIAWIGSLQMFLLFFVGTFSGRALDAGFFRHTVAVGAALNILGIFITSICKQYWQVLLAQGVCTGIGSGLQFAPAMSLVSTYFSTNRNLAIGVVATGSATGGMVYPVIFQQLLPRVGFGWAVRTLGFLNLGLSALVVAFMASRLPPRTSASLLDLEALKDPTYLLCCAAMVLNFLAVYFTFYYASSDPRCLLLSYAD